MKYFKSLNALLAALLLFSTGFPLIPESYATIILPPIEGPIVKKVSIVVPDLTPISGSFGDSRAKEFIDVLRADLKHSGLFSVIDRGAYSNKQIDFQSLFEREIDAVVKGDFKIVHDRIEISIRLFSVSQEEVLVGRSYEASESRVREAAHRFANMVMKELTGLNGFFTSKIVYVGKSGGARDLYLMDYDGKNVRRLTSHKALVLSPNCSRSGTKIVFNSDKVWDQDIYVLNLIPRVRESRLTRGLRLEQSAEWSPDGSRLAFSSKADIYVSNANGSNPKRLTRSSAIDISPTWSPDGKKIAFVSDRAGSPKIYVMNSNGSGLKLITPHGYNTDPSWSPSSKINKIAFVRVEGAEANIFTINPDGTGEQRLTWSSRRNENPAWSADSHYIAFSSNRSGTKDIYLMYLTGANQSRLTKGGGKSFPTWCK